MSLKIISFCNYPYREIALNWVKHLEALSIDNYEVLCLDPESDEYLKSHGMIDIVIPRSEQKAKISKLLKSLTFCSDLGITISIIP